MFEENCLVHSSVEFVRHLQMEIINHLAIVGQRLADREIVCFTNTSVFPYIVYTLLYCYENHEYKHSMITIDQKNLQLNNFTIEFNHKIRKIHK